MTAPTKTSLSELPEAEWRDISNRFNRGWDWIVEKIGRRWQIMGRIGRGFGLFDTKTAAYNAASTLYLAEASYRAWMRESAE